MKSKIKIDYYDQNGDIITNPVEGQKAFSKETQKLYIYTNGEWKLVEGDINLGMNIYDMNKARPTNKFKLNSIMLRDIYDAKNVATLMMERDTIVVVNLSQLSDEQKVRAMDFLDGAKYVTKSLFARFAENICAFVPETVELYCDFFSQIDLGSFNK